MSNEAKRYFTDLAIYPERLPIESVKDSFVVLAAAHDAAVNALRSELEALRSQLETARGLLGDALEILSRVPDDVVPPDHPIYGLLRRQIATSAPEVPDHLRDSAKMVEQPSAAQVPEVSGIGRDADHPRALVLYLRAEPTDDDIRAVQEALRRSGAEQGERQEAVAWSLRLPDGRTTLEKAYPKWAEGEGDGYAIQPLYTSPPPAQGVRPLVEALEFSERMLVNLQPHIPQSCYPGRSGFIDNYVDPVIDKINEALAAYRKANP